MIWNKEKQHFNWLFVILIAYCACFLVGFDLAWRLVNMSLVQLLLMSMAAWFAGAVAIYFTCRKL